jgi:hypothetical protein
MCVDGILNYFFAIAASVYIFAGLFKKVSDSVAQLVEQYTFNVWVLGSNPSGITV